MKQVTWLFLLVVLVFLAGCSRQATPEKRQKKDTNSFSQEQLVRQPAETLETTTQVLESEETTTMNHLVITVGDQVFQGAFANTETAEAFKRRLPLSITMDDLHSNEKYYYFSSSFPIAEEQIGQINTGDLMLYGSNCLVLFYQSFSTNYSYSRIATLDDPNGLTQVLGKRDVEITFEVIE